MCFEGLPRPDFLPECKSGPALPFLCRVLRVSRTHSFQETPDNYPQVSLQALLQCTGGRDAHRSVWVLDLAHLLQAVLHSDSSWLPQDKQVNGVTLGKMGLSKSPEFPKSTNSTSLRYGRVFSCLLLSTIS